MGLLAAWGIAEFVMVAAIVTVIEIGGLLLVILWGFGDASGSVVTVSELIPPLQEARWQGVKNLSSSPGDYTNRAPCDISEVFAKHED